MAPTHEVLNQVPPLTGYSALETDAPLVEGLRRIGNDRVFASLQALGRRGGDLDVQRWATEANAYPPVLRTHDRYGHRIDEVDYHPSWHRLMELSVGEGLHATPWTSSDPHAHLRRAAGFCLTSQAEAGHGCPISMTYAVRPALRHSDELSARFEPGLGSTTYDFGLRDPAIKSGLIAGMAMTEKQGGSDVRANTTRAVPGSDGTWRLTGHKWFCSAPMSDLFLVLAQVDGVGLSCFLVPRVLPGGDRNPFALQRLKDKLGDRSNASSEVEFAGTTGWLVGEPGRGVPAIIEMVATTRLDCVLGSAATMRAALTQAIHHADHRRAFGALLAEQPLMQNVLADLAVESEAATALAIRLAAALDAGEADFLRLAGAAAKFWVCKRTAATVAEALEVLGGNGYVEDSGLPRLYRQAPLNSIWEGSGNVIALDVLRAMGRHSDSLAAVTAEIELARGNDPRFDEAVKRLSAELGDADQLPMRARRIAGLLALCLQGSLLLRSAPPAIADVFCAPRLGGDWGAVLGTLPAGTATRTIVARAAVRPA